MEENSYFRNVIKDAISDLKENGSACVFSQEQVDEILQELSKENIEVNFDGMFFWLSMNNVKKKEVKNDNRETFKRI